MGYLLVRVGHALAQRWTQALAPFGLSARQHGVLAVLARQPDIGVGALARQVMITPQSMGTLVTGLEERGLVRRRQPSGRGHAASLDVTGAGHELLARVQDVVEDSNAPETLGVTPAESAELARILAKVLVTM